MANLKTHRINQTVLLLAVCVASAMLGFALRDNKAIAAKSLPVATLLQSDEKVIEKQDFPNEPFELDDLSVRNFSIVPHQKFSAKSIAENNSTGIGDWLENLKFVIKNKVDKRITYIYIELDFPETETIGPMMVYNKLSIGIHPKAFGDSLKHDTPLALEPGGKTTFTLSAQRLRLIKDFLAFRNFQLEDLNKAVIRISYVIFDDGTKWSLGDYYKPDPSVPGGYQRIN
ncbi:MAG: hypothetical protein WBV94_25590 [Blastocatellia bacterium]